MAEEKKNLEVDNETKDTAKSSIKSSRASKTRKTVAYLQKMKDEGNKLVQVCPGGRDPYFALAAEMADVDICRFICPTNMGVPGNMREYVDHSAWWIRYVRDRAKNIHLNFMMESLCYATKEDGLRYGAEYTYAGADSFLTMGISNEVLKAMSDFYIPVFSHVGAISGWQTPATGGYKRCGKTAEDAMRVFKWAYEYQENGMKAMTIELTPIEVTNAIAKKLRVPVISIAAGGEADGSEMVDYDTFGMMPSPVSHTVTYGDFFGWATDIYGQWVDAVRTGKYPEDKHGYHMDPVELEKFTDAIEKF